MDFLRRLFGMMDSASARVERSGERIATAAEDMADAWEDAARRVRDRLAGSADETPPALPAAAVEVPVTVRRGRKAAVNGTHS